VRNDGFRRIAGVRGLRAGVFGKSVEAVKRPRSIAGARMDRNRADRIGGAAGISAPDQRIDHDRKPGSCAPSAKPYSVTPAST